MQGLIFKGGERLRSVLPRLFMAAGLFIALIRAWKIASVLTLLPKGHGCLWAQIIGLMADDPEFSAYGERWLKSSLLSARCGYVARYRYGSLSLCADFNSR
jgi:hypothetical protein